MGVCSCLLYEWDSASAALLPKFYYIMNISLNYLMTVEIHIFIIAVDAEFASLVIF